MVLDLKMSLPLEFIWTRNKSLWTLLDKVNLPVSLIVSVTKSRHRYVLLVDPSKALMDIGSLRLIERT